MISVLAPFLISGLVAASISEPPFRFEDIAKYAVVPECKQIFESNEFGCPGERCNGFVNGTELFQPVPGKVGFSSAMVLLNKQLKTIIVSYRSSEGVDNWFVDSWMWTKDLSAWDQKFPTHKIKSLPRNIKIHYGLQRTYFHVRVALLNASKRAADLYPDFKIVFTGLSLGAASAQLGAVDFFDQYGMGDRIYVYVYGAPRIGNHAWRDFVNTSKISERIYRVNSYGDPVSFLPPRWLSYFHIGRQFNFKNFGPFKECARDSKGESPECYHKLWETRKDRHFDYYRWTGSCESQ